MIPLMLAVLLVGSQAQLPNLLGSLVKPSIEEPLNGLNSLGKAVTFNKLKPVDAAAKVVKTGTVGVVDLTSDARQDDVGGIGVAAGRVVNQATSGVKKEVAAVAQPVESVALNVALGQCDFLKKILNVDAYSMKSLNNQDLNQLTLNYINPSVQLVFKLSEAVRLLSAGRDFNPDLPLIIFAHGFISSPTSDSFTTILDAFHKKGQYNVLALDSSAYLGWFYLRASTYVQFVGQKLGEMLAAMVQRGLNPKAIHLIGHSLGAHISGFTGKEFTRLTGQRVGRISGLDPAGPCFYNVGSNLKLDATDAEFVDVIHTTHGSLGLTDPIGDVDFYPNGGTQQPDCTLPTCSHERAWAFYAESIVNEEAFPAVECAGWEQFRQNRCTQNKALMGYGCSPDTRGLFFLQTRGTAPYGLGNAGTLYTNNEGLLKSLQPLGPSAPRQLANKQPSNSKQKPLN